MHNDNQSDVAYLQLVIEELKSLNEIASVINASLSVEHITQVIIDKSLKHLHASQGAVFLLENKKKPDILKTFVRRSSGKSQEIPIHLNMSIIGWMIKYKKLLIINSPRENNPFNRLDLESLGISSLLAAPLLTPNGMIGVLAVFNKKNKHGFTNRDCSFLEILVSQCAQVIESARLYEEEKQLTVLREELEIVRLIQQSFLPNVDELINDMSMYGFNIPAREVGGDFFDIASLDREKMFFSIGDVVGKGVPAALLMSNALAVERAHLSNHNTFSLTSLATNLNQLLCQFNKPGQFITAYFCVYDKSNNTFESVNAGHPPPIIVNNNQLIQCDTVAEVVLGVVDNMQYHSTTIKLPNDSTVCIFTDGITEAFNEYGESYGERRLVNFLRHVSIKSAREICELLLADINAFHGQAIQSDDITVIVFKT